MAAQYLSRDANVLLVSKTEAELSNSAWAQGGIACAVDPEDSVEAHVEDTIVSGADLGDKVVIKKILSEARQSLEDLEKLGVSFARESIEASEYDLGHEGGHNARRILHAGDATGKVMIEALLNAVRSNERIKTLEHHMAIDLVNTGWLGLEGENRCVGAYFLNKKNGEIVAARAGHVIMATGGAGKVYLYTSNPDVATGDGLAMAWRAGLPICNLEMVQFHPTCLFHPEAKSFLISEAVRGEGGILLNAGGEAFMERYDSRKELAPRDIVARAIDHEMKRRGDACVFLDISHKSKEFIQKRFPTIYETCLRYGIDIAETPIPVVPAAHYFCGGIAAGVDGATMLDGLSVCGEVAHTGLHGANRLASNSLLEGMVCARLMSERLLADKALWQREQVEIPAWQLGNAVPSDEAVVVEHNWNEVRTCMWDYVGIVRTNKRLERASRRIENLRQEIRQYYLDYLVTSDVLELRNITDVAAIVVQSAQQRKESRGLHYTLDYPDLSKEKKNTVLVRELVRSPSVVG